MSETELAVYTFSKTGIDGGSEEDAVESWRTVLKKGANGKWRAEESGKGYILLKTVQVGDKDRFLSFEPQNGEWHWGEPPAT